ncbi:MAG: phytanoyl-CoA dioxygenase family protein [Candidatus Latescibacteria bacterium]|nr:phytanoyl-CoA dioxygenase family protein [Candidatus Latescibacterota bacterium]
MPTDQQTLAHEPMPEEVLSPILNDFYKNGATIIRNVLSCDECKSICRRVDEIFDDPHYASTRNVKVRPNLEGRKPIVVHRLFECDRMFRDLLVREPIISIAETVLGPHSHCIAQGCILNRKDFGINRFHVDDGLEFPITNDEVKRHDPCIRMPVLRMSVQIALTDQDEDQYGPSQFVPGSHYAGRMPEDQANPNFEGQDPVSLHMKAGDLYLLNGQTWHRGAPNTSDRIRYLFHQVYGQRFVAQRFWPYLNYHMPPHVLDGADDRLMRVLGQHPEMAYG